MKTFKTILPSIILLFFFVSTLAQDKILLMNAKIIESKVLEINDEFVKYKKFDKQDGAAKMIPTEKVYMVTYENSDYKILYKKDPNDPFAQEPEDKRMEISGMQDAKQYYKAGSNFYWGMAVGFLGGVLGDVRYAPIPPLIFATVSEMHAPCLSKQQLSYCFDLCNENYVTGYMRKAGNKKVNNSMLGGLVGIGIGYLGFIVLNDPIGKFFESRSSN
ncbi:MAG: hypothetical protein JKY33_07610 [Bacteroidia bacterium]|nr:hypothetical protein [Bacteroidia bacterium]